MKVLLIQPPTPPNIIGEGTIYLCEPLALEVIGAAIPHHDVRILDMRIDSDLAGMLASFEPDVVGVTSYTPGVYRTQAILNEIKNHRSDIYTFVGGHHATVLPEDFNLPSCNGIVQGEGDVTFREIVDALEKGESIDDIEGLAVPRDGGLKINPSRPFIDDLESVANPARHLVADYRTQYFSRSHKAVSSMITSRGCPFRCTFCSLWKVYGGTYRTRKASSIVDEIEQLDAEYIEFADDNTLHIIKRASEICRLLKERGIKKRYKILGRADKIARNPSIIEEWKDVGLDSIVVGFESFRDDELKAINKATNVKQNNEAIRIMQANGVNIVASFVIRQDYDEDDFKALGDYVEERGLKQGNFSALTPLPGTDLYTDRYDEFLTYDYELFDFYHTVLPTKLPLEVFYKNMAELYRRCFFGHGERELPEAVANAIDQMMTLFSEAHTHYDRPS